jgi:hypothetical protein
MTLKMLKDLELQTVRKAQKVIVALKNREKWHLNQCMTEFIKHLTSRIKLKLNSINKQLPKIYSNKLLIEKNIRFIQNVE